jgi:hypothetical protein
MDVLEPNRDWLLGRLKRSLKLLAAPADIQLRTVPPFGHKAGELYMSFNHWRVKVIGSFPSEIAIDQRFLLDSMERTFRGMGRECWTDDGVSSSPEWEHVRLLSSKTLQTFGWLH